MVIFRITVKNNEVKINNQAKELKLNSGGIKSFLAGMALQYNPGVMPTFSGGIQFKLDNTSYFLTIKDNRCRAYAGEISNPTTTITTKAETWIDIANGKLNGQQAVLNGNMKVEGELSLLMKMGDLFGRNRQRHKNNAVKKEKSDNIKQHSVGFCLQPK